MGWADEAAEQLERLLHDPMAEAVPGVAEVVSVSEPAGRGRYQQATIGLVVSAPGLEPTPVTTTGVFSTKTWPVVGMRVPVRVPVSDPAALEVDWEQAAR